MPSFAAPADLETYYDSRRISQLASDSGTPATDLANNAIVLAMLARATEEILSHALKGKKYTEDELQTLADSETGGFFLVGLCCDLAYGYLVQRRGTGAADMDRQAPAFKTAQLKLLQLADGSEIFPRIEDGQHGDAGTPDITGLDNRTTSPCDRYTSRAYVRLLPSRRPNGRSSGSCGSC
jgi:phage gp36-like protein